MIDLSRLRNLAIGAVAISSLLVTIPASAAVLGVTFDTPNQVVTAPSSGSTVVTFSGTVTNNTSEDADINSLTLQFPFDSAGDLLTGQIPLPNALFGTLAAHTTSLDVTFFTLTVPSSANPGLYQFDSSLTTPPLFIVGGDDPTDRDISFSGSAPFSLEVDPTGVTSTPEPSSLTGMLFGILGLGTMSLFARRRVAAKAL